jgi:ring-1,2-phenylacetyl-CoA epoxidase subunit PaaA
MAQDALDRWWWPSLMMFGPPDADSVHSAQSSAGRSSSCPTTSCASASSTRRCRRRSSWAHDPRSRSCASNEATGHYDIGPIDWAEFKAVLAGHGPCNRERLATRVKAWEDGAWVRDAAHGACAQAAAREAKEVA